MKNKCKDKKQKKQGAKLVFKRILIILLAIAAYSLFTTFMSDVVLDKWLGLYDKLDEGLSMLIGYVLAAGFLVLLLAILKRMGVLKFSWIGFKKGLFAGLTFLIVAAVFLLFSIKISIDSGLPAAPLGSAIAMSVAIIVGVGFTEELLFRGIVENVMFEIFGRKTRKGVILAVIATGVMFGLWHILNINVEGANWSYTVGQVVSVIGLGIAFSAIYARSGSIWAVALIHGFWDFGLMVKNAWFITGSGLLSFEAFEDVPVMFGFFVGLIPCTLGVVYALFLLRKKKKSEYIVSMRRHS